jgi:hypothetical protein
MTKGMNAMAGMTLTRTPTWGELRDDALAMALQERLSHDQRTAHLALEVRVDGGVAHVSGTVADET